MKFISILGATGSIGKNTLDIVLQYPVEYQVYAVTAYDNVAAMYELCLRAKPKIAVLIVADAAEELRNKLQHEGSETEVLFGLEAILEVVAVASVDIVVSAIVGAAGLLPTFAAVKAGKRVLLANKEPIVMAGELLLDAVKEYNAELLPIDSEHNAIFQCLSQTTQQQVVAGFGVQSSSEKIDRVTLTASGGPCLNLPIEQLHQVTPEQACKHPNWSMGKKISVDSATMMNKVLEVIEAFYLFQLLPEQIEVLIHPESIVHSIVTYQDGSCLAQMSLPDMRIPISYCLEWPNRGSMTNQPLRLSEYGMLHFEQLCLKRFPCFAFAQQVIEQGGTAATLLNAANEVAVLSFLKGEISFTAIPVIIQKALANKPIESISDLNDVLEADQAARNETSKVITKEFFNG